MSKEADAAGGEVRYEDRLPTIEAEKEPEYVGAYSLLHGAECRNWVGDVTIHIEPCGAEATHTVVMGDGSGLHPVPMCDDCGEPDDVETDREWSGEVLVDA